MKMGEIRNIAKSLKINSFGKTKVELVREIQLKQGHFSCFATVTDYCDQADCCFKKSCFEEAKKVPDRTC